MDQTTRRTLIERYQDGPRVVAEALGQIGEAELDARPGPDEWTVREIVHHLADSEMTSAIRLRRLLVEDAPVVTGYDERAFARRLTADRPLAAALDAFAAARRTTAEILERLDEADWARAGTHSESGRYSVEDWLAIYAAHAHDHAAQIGRVRAAASNPGR